MDAQSTIEDQKQMLDYLHKRSKEHLKEKNSLIETISELENELMKKEKLRKELSDYHRNSRDEYKETLASMNKKKEISNKLIKTLQIENENLKNKLKNVNSDKSIEVNNLIKEIAAIKAVNNDKEILIEKVSIEKEIIEGKLVELEKEAEDLKQKLEAKDSEREENKSLGEELGISDPQSQNVVAECEPCGDRSQKPEDLKNHQLNLKESEFNI